MAIGGFKFNPDFNSINKTLQQIRSWLFGGIADLFAKTLTVTSFKVSGAEQLKVYTYQGTLDATDVSNGYIDIAVTAVVIDSVRSLTSTLSTGAKAYGTTAAPYETQPSLQSTTSCRVLVNNITLGHKVSLTIIEAT